MRGNPPADTQPRRGTIRGTEPSTEIIDLDTDKDTDMTRRKRKKEPRLDRRLRPHLLRNQWNEFAPDDERRAKFSQGLQRLQPGATAFEDWWVIYQAATGAGYTSRHARRWAEHRWVLQEPEEQEGQSQ